MSAQDCLAIDIGGTKIACGVVSPSGDLIYRDSVPTPQGADQEELFSTLMGLVEKVVSESGLGVSVCGVGCGGPMEAGGVTVSPLNIEGWRSFPLQQRLAGALEIPVAIDNDAKALALGEWWNGAGQEASSCVAMVVSTGIGGGIVLDDHLLDGQFGNAGHIGHIVVDPNGRRCRCGVIGCLEAQASGTAIQEIAGMPAKDVDDGMKALAGMFVGRAVASVVTLLDLDLCVVAGSVALGFGYPFFEAAQQELNRCTGLSYTKGARIVPAGHGDAGPLVGAAAVGFGLGRLAKAGR